ncbi:MAG: metallophosphoesterase [Phototrophicaceae bacterium]
MIALYILSFLVIFIAILLAYATLIEIKWFEITEPDLHITGLHPTLDGYRIVQLSDIHMDSSMTRERLKKIAIMVNDLKPDLIVITGDFVSYEVEYVTEDLRDALSNFQAKDGVFAVMGNHDHLTGVERVRDILKDIGIQELENDYVKIEGDNGYFYLAGVDDLSSQKARLDILLPKIPDDAPVILLAHAPDFADVAAATGRFALQLSGHTHGGQVQIPYIGTLYGPEHGHVYQDGLYDVGNGLQVYVSRGVGTVTLPIRFNCRPEITHITLSSANKN